MVCQGLESFVISDIGSLLAYPSTCDYYFWPKIMFGLWLFLVIGLYFSERTRDNKPDLISIMGVSSIAILFISVVSTLLGILDSSLLIQIFVALSIFIVLWIFKKDAP